MVKIGEVIFLRPTKYLGCPWIKTIIQDVDPNYKHFCVYLSKKVSSKQWIPFHHLTPDTVIYLESPKSILYNKHKEPLKYLDLT